MIASGAQRMSWRALGATLALASIAACTASADPVAESDTASTTTASSAAPSGGPSTSAPLASASDTTTSSTPQPLATAPVEAPDASTLPSIAEPDPAITIGELDNGLRYLIRANDNPGARVDMRLAVDAGSVLEDDSQIGGAHFLEHMLFNGTERYPRNEMIALLRSFGSAFGADVNAFTSFDETVYRLTMPTEDPEVVAAGIDVLHQWLTAATIAEDDVAAERGIVLDEWRTRNSNADGRVLAAVEELLLEGTGYAGRLPIGTRTAIEAMTAPPLRRFYDDWYRPDNVGLVVVGDIEPAVIERQIVEQFSDAVDRGSGPAQPAIPVLPSTEPQAVVHLEPDAADGWALVTVPTAVDTTLTPESAYQRDLLDFLLFDIVATRLNDDALRGDAPFDEAQVDDIDIVDALDVRGIFVEADAEDLEASTQAVLDELERVRRFGVTVAEVDRAVASVRSVVEAAFERRDTRQDSLFAEQYVEHLLVDRAIPTADDQLAFETAVLDETSPATVGYGLAQRLQQGAPHLLVVAPEADAADVPDAATFASQAETMESRVLAERPAPSAVGAALMDVPDVVDPATTYQMVDDSNVSFVDPVVLEYDNGVRVVFNATNIVDNSISFEARRAGGLRDVADGDVVSAMAAGAVVGASGAGDFGPVELAAFLDDKEVALERSIGVFEERMSGSSSTDDLETLLQLIHLAITAPRVDGLFLERYVDEVLPFAENPGLDPGYAEFVALSNARYDDPRFLPATPEALRALEVAGVERVYRERFGDAGGFTFAFTGDLPNGRLRELAGRYLGSLPGSGARPPQPIVEPPPPPGIVRTAVTAGQSESAAVTFEFTAPGGTDPRLDVLAAVAQEIVDVRLGDTIREELGDTYSPTASVAVGPGPEPYIETYLSNTTGPDDVDEVANAVLAQLADLRDRGPSDAEFTAARTTVEQRFELYYNQQINDQILDVFTDPAGTASLDEFLQRSQLVASVERNDVVEFLRNAISLDQYIEIRVLPR